MENIIQVQGRDDSGKGVARKLRGNRRVPGICYGKSFENPVTLSVDKLELTKIVRNSSPTSLFKLASDQKNIDGQMVLIKSRQNHPITNDIIHVDFLAVKKGEKIKVLVPIELKGKAKGVAEGGILQQPNRKLNVRCLPDNIPTKIEVDITSLDINQSLHVSDIQLPEGVTVVGTIDYTLAVVVPPEKEEAAQVADPTAAAAAAKVEPEVTAQKSEGKDAEADKAGDKKEAKKS